MGEEKRRFIIVPLRKHLREKGLKMFTNTLKSKTSAAYHVKSYPRNLPTQRTKIYESRTNESTNFKFLIVSVSASIKSTQDKKGQICNVCA